MYKTVADNPYIQDYISQSMEVMQQLHPEWDADILEKKIIKIVKKRCQNPPVVIDNNYTGESAETSLVAVFGWAKERKPIIAGNGTFYQNQHENLSPCSQMLIDILGNRAKIKAEMFSIEDVNSYAF